MTAGGCAARAASLRAVLLATIAATSSCSFKWDTSAPPEWPFTNSAPPLSQFQKLNDVPASAASIVMATDGVPWAAFCAEFAPAETGAAGQVAPCRSLHLVRLAEPAAEEVVTGEMVEVRPRSVQWTRARPPAAVDVGLHRPGDPPERDFVIHDPGAGSPYVQLSLDDSVAFFSLTAGFPPMMAVRRHDPPAEGTHLVPGFYDQEQPYASQLSDDGRLLLLALTWPGAPYGQSHRIVAYWTAEATTTHLTLLPEDSGGKISHFFVDEAGHQAIFGTTAGLYAVPLAGGPPRRLLDGEVYEGWLDWFSKAKLAIIHSGELHYDVFRVPLDGGEPTLLREDLYWLRAVGPRNELVFTLSDAPIVAGYASEAWLQGAGDRPGTWRVMERGTLPSFSRDGRRLRFLEHAGSYDQIGDLRSVTLPLPASPADITSDPSFTIARNVHCFDEAPDGAVLAVENDAVYGPWSRLVRLDEEKKTRTWLAPSAECFVLVPGRNEVLIDVVNRLGTFDIYRVPLDVP